MQKSAINSLKIEYYTSIYLSVHIFFCKFFFNPMLPGKMQCSLKFSLVEMLLHTQLYKCSALKESFSEPCNFIWFPLSLRFQKNKKKILTKTINICAVIFIILNHYKNSNEYIHFQCTYIGAFTIHQNTSRNLVMHLLLSTKIYINYQPIYKNKKRLADNHKSQFSHLLRVRTPMSFDILFKQHRGQLPDGKGAIPI